MSQHRSLRSSGTIAAKRNVLKRFERVDLPRYYVPLTPLGKIALKFGLHHKLMDQLPKPVAARLRQFRSSWYSRKLHSAVEAS